MDDAMVLPAGAGEVIGDAPDRRVELLCDRDPLHVTWSRFGPGREGADLHVHRHHTDLFYVLDGELTVRLGRGGEQVVVPAGTLVRVPPLVVHGFRNGGTTDVRYLNLHAPGRGFAAFMRGLRDGRPVAYDQEEPPADGGRPPTEAVVGGEPGREERDGVQVRLLADVAPIAVAELRGEPGATLPPPPRPGELEAFFVLAGELTLTGGDREQRARAGAWVLRPPGAAVQVAPRAPGAVRVLRLRAPGTGAG